MPCKLCTDPDGVACFPVYGTGQQGADGFTPDSAEPGFGTWWCIHCGHGKPDERATAAYTPGEWYQAETVEELQAFYLSRLPSIREAAQAHGYAIGLHGSTRRDLDLIAAPWRAGASDADTLAHAIAQAACGIDRAGAYDWEQKPAGRVATSIPICWPAWHGQPGAGHIDLSVMPELTEASDVRNLVSMAYEQGKRHAEIEALEHTLFPNG